MTAYRTMRTMRKLPKGPRIKPCDWRAGYISGDDPLTLCVDVGLWRARMACVPRNLPGCALEGVAESGVRLDRVAGLLESIEQHRAKSNPRRCYADRETAPCS